MKKQIKIKDILLTYKNGGIQAVSFLLHQHTIDPSTWAGQLKKDIDEKRILTAMSKIELLTYKLLKNKEHEGENSEPEG